MLGGTAYSVRVKTGVGILPVQVTGQVEEALVTMTQSSVEFGQYLTQDERSDLIQAFGADEGELDSSLPVQVVSTGHSKVMVPFKTRSYIDQLTPDAQALSDLSTRIGCDGYFTICICDAPDGIETFGRMFAPAIGIYENPVSGNANGPAGAYLSKYGLLRSTGRLTYSGHQGHRMGRPGTVYVTVDRIAEQTKIQIAGHAVLAGTQTYPTPS